jgi:protocatechuate 3,4-dioxygenase beta subunit
VIIGARVTIADVSTNISNTTATDERGFYIFNGLHPATYIVKAEASRYKQRSARGDLGLHPRGARQGEVK